MQVLPIDDQYSHCCPKHCSKDYKSSNKFAQILANFVIMPVDARVAVIIIVCSFLFKIDQLNFIV